MAVISDKICKILTEEAVHLRPGATNLRSEMSRVMEFLTHTTLPRYRLGKTDFPKHVSFTC